VSTVTALHPAGRGRIRVELDGSPWRTLPEAVVAAGGLRVGIALGRERAREVRRALRSAEALGAATRALARRDRTVAELSAVLARHGATSTESAQVLATLGRYGYVDDLRFAAGRALALAGRGFGDAAIRADLDGRGVDEKAGAAAVAALEPEVERARRLVSKAGERPEKAARRLLAKGFSADAVEAVLGLPAD
jgi:SOS response regulatory protein OraA/RecX